MELSQSYRAFFTRFLKFSSAMAIVALLSGILFQESAKKAPYSDVLTPGVHLETVFNLSLVHGHVFLIGMLIPMALLAMLYFGQALGNGAVSDKALKLGGWAYIWGAVVSIGLMLYKGYHYLLSVRFGEMDFAVIEASYFGGVSWLRHLVYALCHISMAFGLGWLIISYWKSLGGQKQA